MMVRLPNVHAVRSKGRVYYYHRPTRTRLPGDPRSAEFAERLGELEKQAAGKEPAAGTFGALVKAYRAAPEFTNLAPRTISDYDKVFDWLARLDDVALARIDEALVIGLRDKAFAKKKRRFANYVVQVMRLVLKWGRPRKMKAATSAEGVPLIRRPRKMARANRAWTDAERATVLAAASPQVRVGLALGMYAAMREGDVVRFTWTGYDGTAVEWAQGKTDDPVWLPAHKDLRAILDAAKEERAELQRKAVAEGKVVTVCPQVVANRYGKPFTESGFRASFFKLIAKLEEEGKVAPGLTFHGLRHSVGKLLADAGTDVRTIAAALGHKSLAMATLYSDEADRKKRARKAITVLERNGPRTRKCKTARTTAVKPPETDPLSH